MPYVARRAMRVHVCVCVCVCVREREREREREEEIEEHGLRDHRGLHSIKKENLECKRSRSA